MKKVGALKKLIIQVAGGFVTKKKKKIFLTFSNVLIDRLSWLLSTSSTSCLLMAAPCVANWMSVDGSRSSLEWCRGWWAIGGDFGVNRKQVFFFCLSVVLSLFIGFPCIPVRHEFYAGLESARAVNCRCRAWVYPGSILFSDFVGSVEKGISYKLLAKRITIGKAPFMLVGYDGFILRLNFSLLFQISLFTRISYGLWNWPFILPPVVGQEWRLASPILWGLNANLDLL